MVNKADQILQCFGDNPHSPSAVLKHQLKLSNTVAANVQIPHDEYGQFTFRDGSVLLFEFDKSNRPIAVVTL